MGTMGIPGGGLSPCASLAALGANTAMHGGGPPSPLQYWPLWVLDFPISIAYFVAPLSIPVYEAIVGPIWWLFVPTIVSKVFRKPTPMKV
jgi:hypothetical protein